MLLDNKYTIIPSIMFSLTYSDGVRKVITVKTRDKIDCSYKKSGEIFNIVGIVTKIGCNFNSSLGTVGTTAYLQVDGSSEYSGQVEYIQPNQVVDLCILSSTGITDNVVCSVDNEDQKITLVRENEVGVMQYSMDGLTWKAVSGAQGMSAYECAVKLGFEGTEEEWFESLRGKDGPPGALEIFRVFKTADDAIKYRCEVPDKKLVVVCNENIPGDNNTQLFVRSLENQNHNYCDCGCSDCTCDHSNSIDEITNNIDGYEFVGYLTLGPRGMQGRPGKDGKSAYQSALDGGFIGSEDEFYESLAKCDVAVTDSYSGPTPRLKNTIEGPINLRVYGYTSSSTFRSKKITHIDVSSPSEVDDQTILFDQEIILRAIPTEKTSAKPNITINGKKYVADCIMNKAGQVGILRRIEYIDNYNGETIIGDWMSSTGELDMGAEVQYTTTGTFIPFSDEVQSQYRKLHSYNGETNIDVTENVHVSVDYPINFTTYIDGIVADKQDHLVAGKNIDISEDNVISTPGAVFTDSFTTTQDVGGLLRGTNINKGDSIEEILKKILSPVVAPEDRHVYWGSSDNVPTSIEGLVKECIDDETLLNGVTHSFDLNNQYPVFAYKHSIGMIKSIKDETGFENIRGWEHFDYRDPNSGLSYYIYYSREPLTIGYDYIFTFLFK